MNILAIDPGNEMSGYVIMNDSLEILEKGKLDNPRIINPVINDLFHRTNPLIEKSILLVEMVGSYGMPVGQTVFDTCVWIGRFIQEWHCESCHSPYYKVYRKAQNKIDKIDSVCMTLCKSTRAKDPNVRQAVLDRFPATGGGKIPQIGIKSAPGPLYGVSGDVWSALAVALTFLESECYFKLTSELDAPDVYGDLF